MWGQGAVSICHKLAPGIIPTRVGTREKHWLSSTKHRDHPHACGDKLLPQILYKGGVGSSPRVWGQEFVTLGLFAFARIIPTRMGTRVCYLGFVCLCQDHPHAYGDKQLSLTLSVMLRGSSPRVWGQAKDGATVVVSNGIIPTRMGTSKQRYRNCHNRRDHPHAYGDKY